MRRRGSRTVDDVGLGPRVSCRKGTLMDIALAQPLNFIPCFMQVTKVSAPYTGPLPIPQVDNLIGSAGFDHNNPQPITVDLHIWSWFDGVVKMKDAKSGLPIDHLDSPNGIGQTVDQPPPGTMTPFDTKVHVPQRYLQGIYDLNKAMNMAQSLAYINVLAYRMIAKQPVLLCKGVLAIGVA